MTSPEHLLGVQPRQGRADSGRGRLGHEWRRPSKDGVDLSITYITSINPVRQKEQAIIKQALEKIGFSVELRQVDAAVFFDGSAGNDQNINHFYNDLQMYTNNATTPIPVAYMIAFYAGPEGENIAQKANELERPELQPLP